MRDSLHLLMSHHGIGISSGRVVVVVVGIIVEVVVDVDAVSVMVVCCVEVVVDGSDVVVVCRFSCGVWGERMVRAITVKAMSANPMRRIILSMLSLG